MSNILLITDSNEDYYYRPFVEENKKRGNPVSIYLFYWAEFPKHFSMSVSLNQHGLVEGYVDVISTSTGEKYFLNVADITVAWYLRPHPMDRELYATLDDEEFTIHQNESRCALISLFSCLQCLWINRRDKVLTLEGNKLYQQQCAICAGLATPQTLISSCDEDILSFQSEDDALLLKTFNPITRTTEDGKSYFIYAQRVPRTFLKSKKSQLSNGPLYIQRYVSKKYEHRVTIAGSSVSNCRISSQVNKKTEVDWRHYDIDKTPHEKVLLPNEIESKLLDFMNIVNLQYGAIDLIETPTGEFVFLEINPAGQWDWVNHLANLSIPSAVLDMMIKIANK